jgi:hypothetical protein
MHLSSLTYIKVFRLNYLRNMQIGLIDVNTCEPIENVLLDIWHCDALGMCGCIFARKLKT